MGKPVPIPPSTKGPQHAVPCPHCGHPNDFRELQEHRVEVGDFAACDKCNGVMEVTAMQPVMVVHVRRRTDMKAQRPQRVGQSTTLSPQQARRLLR